MTEPTNSDDVFLAELGQRARTMRGVHGMSRKVLAKVSGISERYIAQLESGKGNVSIVLLRRLAHAMGAPLEDLIPDGDGSTDWPVLRALARKASAQQIVQAKDALSGKASPAQRKLAFSGIALIGLRGAGKSTLGRRLAEDIGWSFRRTEQGDRAAERLVRRRDPRPLRPGRFPPHGADRAGADARAQGAGGACDRRRHRRRAADLRPDPLLLLHGVAEGRARRAHGPRPRPGRPAPDGRRPLGHAGAAHDPAEPRAAVLRALRRRWIRLG